jgi:hypothetical protein
MNYACQIKLRPWAIAAIHRIDVSMAKQMPAVWLDMIPVTPVFAKGNTTLILRLSRRIIWRANMFN